jgi:hypothetical protein
VSLQQVTPLFEWTGAAWQRMPSRWSFHYLPAVQGDLTVQLVRELGFGPGLRRRASRLLPEVVGDLEVYLQRQAMHEIPGARRVCLVRYGATSASLVVTTAGWRLESLPPPVPSQEDTQ